MVLLVASAGVNFRMRPFASFGERIMHGVVPASGKDTTSLAARSVVLFRAVPIGRTVSDNVADLCTRVEVLVTGSNATSSHAKAQADAVAARAGQTDPLREAMHNLHARITPDADPAAAVSARRGALVPVRRIHGARCRATPGGVRSARIRQSPRSHIDRS